ncbi:hypothetical protein IFM89_018949 [Coptis chinensis]|uniref:cAMP-regulated phosphoprotein 19-related protein n=1 Tax=Coptis chinensis TaxID=261450 RepID=A0A835I8T3_9MAGN|nr:hypothetical protein IFM89_018949 [Coptis chinensis]
MEGGKEERQADGDFPEQPDKSMPSPQEEEEAVKKKYGGIVPKKPPLISKDHERAFFDSADWALGKQGTPVEKPKGPLEALRPKLQVLAFFASVIYMTRHRSNIHPHIVSATKMHWITN